MGCGILSSDATICVCLRRVRAIDVGVAAAAAVGACAGRDLYSSSAASLGLGVRKLTVMCKVPSRVTSWPRSHKSSTRLHACLV